MRHTGPEKVCQTAEGVSDRMRRTGPEKAYRIMKRGGEKMDREEYIKQVVKRLQCSSKKKREIEKQLDSHIGIGLAEGRRIEEILAEMGEPAELAQEFNDSFEEEEGKRAKGRRRLIVVLAIVLAVLAAAAGLLYWMLPKERDISESSYFDSEDVVSLAEEVIRLFGEEKYEILEGYFTEEVREAFEETSIETVKEFVSRDWGKFRSMGNVYMTEVRQMGRSYAIVQVNVSFENVSVVFTLTFNEAMEVYGFYVK